MSSSFAAHRGSHAYRDTPPDAMIDEPILEDEDEENDQQQQQPPPSQEREDPSSVLLAPHIITRQPMPVPYPLPVPSMNEEASLGDDGACEDVSFPHQLSPCGRGGSSRSSQGSRESGSDAGGAAVGWRYGLERDEYVGEAGSSSQHAVVITS